MQLFRNVYGSRKVLITGHSGFKGSWLAQWLHLLGASVSGIALPPETDPNHWALLKLECESHWLDIRDCERLSKAIAEINPDIIFHLAAQPLVRRSYRNPLETWQTNLTGTVNLLESARFCSNLKAVICVTTDKCYENKEWCWGYRENDTLGGHDPYSASKAATEIAIASYRKSFFSSADSPLIASARAGNVIGGGDWSEDRIIPDLVRAIGAGEKLEIRSPNATRPWQHVLEPLYGYLLLGQKLLERRAEFADAWNFGPDTSSNCSVSQILNLMQQHWPQLDWFSQTKEQPHEAGLLHLDSSRARALLKWHPLWDLKTTARKTADWYKSFMTDNLLNTCRQIEDYQQDLIDSGRAR